MNEKEMFDFGESPYKPTVNEPKEVAAEVVPETSTVTVEETTTSVIESTEVDNSPSTTEVETVEVSAEVVTELVTEVEEVVEVVEATAEEDEFKKLVLERLNAMNEQITKLNERGRDDGKIKKKYRF